MSYRNRIAPEPAAHEPLSTRLLRETIGAHRAAESSVNLKRLESNLNDYERFLERLLHFHRAATHFCLSAVRSELGDECAGLLDRTNLLEADLSQVALMKGGSPSDDAASHTSTGSVTGREVRRFGCGETAAERVGVAYVAGGSVLGGRVIAARLQRTAPTFPTTFLRCADMAVRESWATFRRGLDRYATASSEVDPVEDRVVTGALAGFAVFRRDPTAWPTEVTVAVSA